MEITIKGINYHRNGVGGNGFYVVQFDYVEDGQNNRMIGIVYANDDKIENLKPDGYVAVLDRNPEDQLNRTMRGDYFEYELLKAVKDWGSIDHWSIRMKEDTYRLENYGLSFRQERERQMDAQGRKRSKA